jgi:hypothetical protein
LVFKESKDYILKFIRSADKPTKNDVIDYMSSKKVPQKKFRTSRMTTIGIINELEASGRLKVLKPEGWRQGQPYHLVANDSSDFVRISEQLTNLESMLRQHPQLEAQDHLLNLLLINLARANKYIKNEGDKQTLNQKIIDLLLKIRYKKSGLASQVTMI